jgi:1-acyl-sn-glycerol-3-phosphate acyltransferase
VAVVSERSEPPSTIIETIERGLRVGTTALSFAIFGLGGLAMALVVFPLFHLVVWDRHKRAQLAQATVHRVWWIYVRIMRAMGTVDFTIDKPDVLKNLRGTVVVANHPSLLDVVFLMSFMQRTRAVVKAGVWRNPFMRGVVTAADYIPNLGDPDRLIADCSAALEDGSNLVIFPEGSRTVDGRLGRFQKGFARAALEAGAPIQIVTIRVDPPMLRKGQPWHYAPPRRGRWTIRVHERIDTVEQYGYDRSASAVRKLTADVADRIEGYMRA